MNKLKKKKKKRLAESIRVKQTFHSLLNFFSFLKVRVAFLVDYDGAANKTEKKKVYAFRMEV